MNGYQMTAEGYRQLAAKGKISREMADKQIRIYDFLGACDDADLCGMVDSTAFNGIIRAYLQTALQDAKVDAETRDSVLNSLRWIMDTKTAWEVLHGKEKN